jgi:hypothetical protein
VYKPNDPVPDRAKQRSCRLAAVTALALLAAAGMLLQLPLGATAGIASGDGDRNAPRAPPVPKTATYQLRCWQHGRLLFDEGPVTLGAEARQGARLVAIDHHGAALIVSVAGEATCQARPYTAVPSLGAAPLDHGPLQPGVAP